MTCKMLLISVLVVCKQSYASRCKRNEIKTKWYKDKGHNVEYRKNVTLFRNEKRVRMFKYVRSQSFH